MCGAAVADDRPLAAGEDRGHLRSQGREDRPNQVDPAMKAPQAARFEQPTDRPALEPRREQLLASNHSVLPRREPRAMVAVTLPSGEEATGDSGGDGPVDAIFHAIQGAVGTECELRQYTVSAVTEGDDALGEVTVMVRAHGRLASGQGVSTDILAASAQAYVRALSNALDGAAVRAAEEATAEAARQPATPGP